MSTVFIGGSRHVSRLFPEIKGRLDNVITSGHHVVIGDANGADKTVQKYLYDAAYNRVTVFCSGEPRNNLGLWPTRKIMPPKNIRGFQFYAAKDREMAREADFGLMVWDGKSAGTILNVLRLMRAGKIAVLFSIPDKRAINIKGQTDWENFLSQCSSDLIQNLRERATPDEWSLGQQASFLDTSVEANPAGSGSTRLSQEVVTSLNAALASADPAVIVDMLGSIAKIHGMTQVASKTGLARESLYRALSSGGNPEFATVLKIVSYLGLHLTVNTSPPLEQAIE